MQSTIRILFHPSACDSSFFPLPCRCQIKRTAAEHSYEGSFDQDRPVLVPGCTLIACLLRILLRRASYRALAVGSPWQSDLKLCPERARRFKMNDIRLTLNVALANLGTDLRFAGATVTAVNICAAHCYVAIPHRQLPCTFWITPYLDGTEGQQPTIERHSPFTSLWASHQMSTSSKSRISKIARRSAMPCVPVGATGPMRLLCRSTVLLQHPQTCALWTSCRVRSILVT